MAVHEVDDIVGTKSVLVRHDSSGGRPRPSAAALRWARPSSCPVPPTRARRTVGYGAGAISRDGTSALHILNADDIDGEAQAVIELPQRVPAGFHGNWVPDLA